MSKKGIKPEDLLESLQDDRITDLLLVRLEKRLGPIIERLFNELASTFTSKLESAIMGMTQTALQTFSDDHNQKITHLEKENQILKAKLDETENQTRLDNLIIYGLGEKPGSDMNVLHHFQSSNNTSIIQSVVGLCNNNLGLAINDSDISLAHYLPGNPKAKYRPILVRFISRRTRDMVYSARKSLRGHSDADPIYVNEHLTRQNSMIFAEARKMVKQKKLISAWTRDGMVYARLSDTPSEKPRKITSMNILENLVPA